MSKIFEDTTTKNVKTGIDFTQETRRLFRELEEKVRKLENTIQVQQELLNQFRIQLAGVQTKLFSGGTN